MKFLSRLLAAGLVAAVLPSAAGAATLVGTQRQTVDGQSFTFNLVSTVLPIGSGRLTFLVRGDFSQGIVPEESFGFNFENVLSDTGIQATAANTLTSYSSDDNLFTTSYALTYDQLVAANADRIFNLVVNFGPGVNAAISANPFVTVTFDFPAVADPSVPEPASWAMMIAGAGLIGGALRRRRNIQTSVRFA